MPDLTPSSVAPDSLSQTPETIAASPRTQKFQIVIEEARLFAEANGVPLIPALVTGECTWLEDAGTRQVVHLHPREGVTAIPAGEFGKIAELQATLLEALQGIDEAEADGITTKCDFIADGSSLSFDKSALNALNYRSIASRLINHKNFGNQIMIVSPDLVSWLTGGIQVVEIFLPKGKRFAAEDRLDRAMVELKKKHEAERIRELKGAPKIPAFS